MYAMNIQNNVIGLVLHENCKSKLTKNIIELNHDYFIESFKILNVFNMSAIEFLPFRWVKFFSNDFNHENCKSKQVTDFIAWPSRCHDTISDTIYKATPIKDLLSYKPPLLQGSPFRWVKFFSNDFNLVSSLYYFQVTLLINSPLYFFVSVLQ
jgi:hypothetical protein